MSNDSSNNFDIHGVFLSRKGAVIAMDSYKARDDFVIKQEKCNKWCIYDEDVKMDGYFYLKNYRLRR
jgi:hypothetical protein